MLITLISSHSLLCAFALFLTKVLWHDLLCALNAFNEQVFMKFNLNFFNLSTSIWRDSKTPTHIFIILFSNFYLKAPTHHSLRASNDNIEGLRIMKDYMAKIFKLFLSSCAINYPTPPPIPIPATSTLNAACENCFFRESRVKNKFLSFISLERRHHPAVKFVYEHDEQV